MRGRAIFRLPRAYGRRQERPSSQAAAQEHLVGLGCPHPGDGQTNVRNACYPPPLSRNLHGLRASETDRRVKPSSDFLPRSISPTYVTACFQALSVCRPPVGLGPLTKPDLVAGTGGAIGTFRKRREAPGESLLSSHQNQSLSQV